MSSMPPCAVLIPARNEGPRIGRVVASVRAVLPESPVLVVDGHSEDHTADEAQAAGAEVLMQQGRGYASALIAGYQALQGRGHRRVLTLDADGQHPPEAAPALVARSIEGWDWVVASRQGTRSPTTLVNRLAHAILAEAVRAASGWRPGDPTSGFHLLQNDGLLRFPEWLRAGWPTPTCGPVRDEQGFGCARCRCGCRGARADGRCTRGFRAGETGCAACVRSPKPGAWCPSRHR